MSVWTNIIFGTIICHWYVTAIVPGMLKLDVSELGIRFIYHWKHIDIHSEQRTITKLTPLQQAYNGNSLLWQFFFYFLLKKLQNKSHESVYYPLGPIRGPWPNLKPIG